MQFCSLENTVVNFPFCTCPPSPPTVGTCESATHTHFFSLMKVPAPHLWQSCQVRQLSNFGRKFWQRLSLGDTAIGSRSQTCTSGARTLVPGWRAHPAAVGVGGVGDVGGRGGRGLGSSRRPLGLTLLPAPPTPDRKQEAASE